MYVYIYAIFFYYYMELLKSIYKKELYLIVLKKNKHLSN